MLSKLQFGAFELNRGKRALSFHGEPVRVSARPLPLLAAFVRRQAKVVTRAGLPVAACLFVGFNLQAQQRSLNVSLKPLAGLEIVQVSLNGTGPYSFVLDTGSNVSMVKRRLLQALKVPISGGVALVGSLSESAHERAELHSVSVSGLSVSDVEVSTLEGPELGSIQGHVDGILGENFLEQFDLLIDNDKQLLVLDKTSQLENSLVGEHVQISHSGISKASSDAHRIFVQLKLPDLVARTVLFLIDSAANTAMFYSLKDELPAVKRRAQYGTIHSLSGDQPCPVERTAVYLGSRRYREVLLATCAGMTRDAIDADGLLPTNIFHRLFICHRNGYVVGNPRAAPNSRVPVDIQASQRDLSREDRD